MTAVDVYGLSDVIGPGVSIACAEVQEGPSPWEDLFYPEIIDPETREVLPRGEEGELVLTTLTKEALAVLRYRTGDITRLNYDRCECGCTAIRTDNATGRTDDLLIVRDVDVYPSRIGDRLEDALDVLRLDELGVVGPGVIERTEIGEVRRVYDHRDE